MYGIIEIQQDFQKLVQTLLPGLDQDMAVLLFDSGGRCGSKFGAAIGFWYKDGTFRVDSEYYVVKFNVPEKFVGYFVNELNLDEEFNLKLIGLKRSNTIKNCLGISLVEHKVVNELPEDAKIRPDDVLVCYGKYSDFQKLWKAL